jgi:IMP dehydrogenase
MESIPLTLTCDDVLLVPRFSFVSTRKEVNCTTRFTRQISLTAPFVSANMDTVTEALIAIVVAEFGGVGVDTSVPAH